MVNFINEAKSAIIKETFDCDKENIKTVILAIMFALVLAGCSAMPSDPSMKSSDHGFIERSSSLPFLGLPEPSSVEEAIANGNNAFAAGNLNKALFEYVRALDLDNENPNIYIKIGNVHNKMRNYNISRIAYEEAIKLDPQNITALESIAALFLRQNNTTQAKYFSSRAITGYIDATPSDKQNIAFPATAYTSMGILMDLEKKHVLALTNYNRVLSNTSESPSIHNNIGYSFYLSGNMRAAEQSFKAAVALNSNYSRAWKNLGLLYARENRYMESINAFEQVSTRAQAYNDVGYICMINNQYPEAEFFFKRAIDLNPMYYSRAKENLELLQWHHNLSKSDKLQTADNIPKQE